MVSKIDQSGSPSPTRPKTGGRQKGTPNKLTKSAREAFQHAFDALGGAEALTDWAQKQPSEFYRLYGRLIPATDSSGKEPFRLTVVWRKSDAQLSDLQSREQ